MDVSKALGTLLKLIVVCLIVGIILHWLNITPENVFQNFGDTVLRLYQAARDAVEWGADYIVTGAIIVIPIWLIIVIMDAVKRRGRKD